MALATRPKTPVHSRKRSAGHHRHSKRYLKTYLPYIPMLCIVAIGLMINSALSSPQHVLGAQSNFSPLAFLNATNHDRTFAGEQPLSLSQQLTAAAQQKANDMVSQNYWAHTSPSGKTGWDFITGNGYTYQLAGENLAYGFSNATAVETAWLNSPDHRKNILTPNYQNVGFGVASSANYQDNGPETVVVAEYAEPIGSAANITFTVNNPKKHGNGNGNSQGGNQNQNAQDISAQPVSRFEQLTGESTIVISAITGAAAAILVIKYGLRFKKIARVSESFIIAHPLFDTTLVFVITIGLLLSKASGFIQ